ncbi:mitochondrial import receptor subunit TOM20 homolog [Ischnura elegans]|uniref:mitochondrial import receptor subunit TOM20 homolog n=1 Tax=Ischnura elegans TaxID=197161 RepID=UPI001ED87DD4|nr:mitochondrial import receptor subunit TOM20 homolog [Ischnura elegans]XP_046400501.1 mitochondrial import receptor subunit TOM20 homolog [Ischnura elegans]
MAIFNMTTIGVAAAFCGTIALGYIIYDRQRKPVNDKRRIKPAPVALDAKHGSLSIPDFKDKYSLQKFFIDEVQRGEELLNQGKDREAVDHFVKATVVCKQRDKFLPVIKDKLSNQVYNMILKGLADVNVSV